MHGQIKDQGADNDRIARVLAHAVDSAGRSRADLAAEAGMHRETLTRLRMPRGSFRSAACPCDRR